MMSALNATIPAGDRLSETLLCASFIVPINCFIELHCRDFFTVTCACLCARHKTCAINRQSSAPNAPRIQIGYGHSVLVVSTCRRPSKTQNVGTIPLLLEVSTWTPPWWHWPARECPLRTLYKKRKDPGFFGREVGNICNHRHVIGRICPFIGKGPGDRVL